MHGGNANHIGPKAPGNALDMVRQDPRLGHRTLI
jgi:hypothetical protein